MKDGMRSSDAVMSNAGMRSKNEVMISEGMRSGKTKSANKPLLPTKEKEEIVLHLHALKHLPPNPTTDRRKEEMISKMLQNQNRLLLKKRLQILLQDKQDRNKTRIRMETNQPAWLIKLSSFFGAALTHAAPKQGWVY